MFWNCLWAFIGLAVFLAVLVLENFENLEDVMLALNRWDPFPCISGLVGIIILHYLSVFIM